MTVILRRPRKECLACKTSKPLTGEHWHRNKRSRDGWASRCRPCAVAAVIASRKAHPEVTSRNDMAALKRRTERQRAYVARLREGTCADCGVHREAMEFDHVPERGPKLANISDLLGKWTGWGRLRAELAKCDLVCADCHARRTFRRTGRVLVVLTEADRAAIRRRRSAGQRNKDLAAEYGVSPSRISSITRRADRPAA